MENREAARSLFVVAALLESQGANPYRVRAYRRAAVRLLRLAEQAQSLTRDDGELDVEWLGDRLRRKVGELVTSGKMQFHQDLLAELPKPLRELMAVPGIGPKTAKRLMEELGVRSPRGVVHAARTVLGEPQGLDLTTEEPVGQLPLPAALPEAPLQSAPNTESAHLPPAA